MLMPKTATTMIRSIPQDLISDILSRLPVKSLIRFKCVSKLWCSLISSSNFINLHLHHSSKNQKILLYDHYLHSINCDVLSTSCNEAVEIASPFDTFELEIIGSCNGLLLISPYQDIVFLWNPSTNELKILPPTPIDFPPRDNYQLTEARAMVFGLGYDSIAKDYKVVRIVVFDGFGSDKDGSEVKVYSLRTDSWRRIGEVPESWKWIGESPYAARDQTLSRSGKHVSGRLHWLLYDKNETESEWAEDGGCTEQLNVSKVIVSFDIEGENYIEVPQPDYRDDSFHMNVDVLGGCLCIHANYDTLVMDVWVMKEYGVKESWTRLFTIAQGQLPAVPSFSHLIPMKLSMEGDILLVVDYRFLVMYEPIHGMAKRLEICNLPNYFETEIYVESLVAMNGVYMGQEQAGWKKKWTDIWNRKLKRMEQGSRKALDKIWPDGYNAVEEIIIRKPELEALTS